MNYKSKVWRSVLFIVLFLLVMSVIAGWATSAVVDETVNQQRPIETILLQTPKPTLIIIPTQALEPTPIIQVATPTQPCEPIPRIEYTEKDLNAYMGITFDEGTTDPFKKGAGTFGTFKEGIFDEYILDAAVVVNRALSPRFKQNTLYRVVFAGGQFHPARDGKVTNVQKIIDEGKVETTRYKKAVQVKEACMAVLYEWDELGVPDTVTFFQASKRKKWGSLQRYYGRYGGHTFFYHKDIMTEADWEQHNEAMAS